MQFKRQIVLKVAAATGLLPAAVVDAMAALPPDVTGAFTAATDNWTSMSPLIWGLVTAITGGFFLIKLFKKGLNKAG